MRRVALITGSSGGIGRATALAFKTESWLTVGIDLVAPEGNGVDRFVLVDLADPDAPRAVFESINDIGRVDALVNNAALQLTKTLAETAPDEWEAVFNVNVRAAALLTQAAVPQLTAHGGAVVNVASVHALATSTAKTAYAASKGALVSLTRACALEFAPQRIRVNAVLPGADEAAVVRIAGDEPLQALFASEEGFESIELVAVAGPYDPGTEATVVFTESLSPGRYALLCFVEDPESGLPHVALGMFSEFEVGGIAPPGTGDAGLADGKSSSLLLQVSVAVTLLSGLGLGARLATRKRA